MSNTVKKPIVLTFMNNKGGVGKTTISASMAYSLSLQNKKVLLIDTDGQGNLSDFYGYDPELEQGEERLFNVLKMKIDKVKCDAALFIKPTDYENIDIIIGDGDLDTIRYHVGQALTKNRRVYKQIIEDIKARDYYDFIIFDTAPVLDSSSTQILIATDFVVIPATDDKFATKAIGRTIEAIEEAREWDEDVELLGVYLNIVPKASSVTSQVRDYLNSAENTEGKLLDSIGEYSKVAHNVTWSSVDSMSKKNKAFLNIDSLREEIMKKIG